jgi:hypothetical protein
MAFRSFAHWANPETLPSAQHEVELRCVGRLSPKDIEEIRNMKHLRKLTLEGIERFPRELCALGELVSLTVTKRGDAGIAELPEELSGLRSLRRLRVRAGRLTRLLPNLRRIALAR